MITEIVLRRAVPSDTALVAAMWTRSSRRLAQRGHDQWQYPVKLHNIRNAINEGSLWLAEHSHHPAGMITVDHHAEPDYWAHDEPDNALYAHRMVTEIWATGNEIGSALLDWAGQQAAKANKKWLRLDAWKTNEALHRYYLARGFQFVRIAGTPEDPSGACFQRPATLTLDRGPRIIEDTQPHEAAL